MIGMGGSLKKTYRDSGVAMSMSSKVCTPISFSGIKNCLDQCRCGSTRSRFARNSSTDGYRMWGEKVMISSSTKTVSVCWACMLAIRGRIYQSYIYPGVLMFNLSLANASGPSRHWYRCDPILKSRFYLPISERSYWGKQHLRFSKRKNWSSRLISRVFGDFLA